MVEGYLCPVGGAKVAVGALTWEMVHWGIAGVARLAICEASVIEVDDEPICCIDMAVGAFSLIVVRWFVLEMAGLALGDVGMVERGHFPIGRICVAGGAFAREVGRGCIFQMARLALCHANVIKLIGFPIVDEVAIGAFTFKVVGGRFVATAALGNCAFILPNLVAGGAFNIVAANKGEEAVVNLA